MYADFFIKNLRKSASSVDKSFYDESFCKPSQKFDDSPQFVVLSTRPNASLGLAIRFLHSRRET
jgi:hypothetical protein